MSSKKLFVSWSGELSRKLAEEVSHFIPDVLQSVDPFFAPDDIEKGAQWPSVLANELSESDVGIICLTRSNLESAWIHYEAGALAKNFRYSRLCTLLFDVDYGDLPDTLKMHQATNFTKNDFKKMIRAINEASDEGRLSDEKLEKAFDRWWGDFEKRVKDILVSHDSSQSEENSLVFDNSQLVTFTARSRSEAKSRGFPWLDAQHLIDIFAPTFWQSIAGLEPGSKSSGVVESLASTNVKKRILLLDPDSSAFVEHNRLLKKMGDVKAPDSSEQYRQQLDRFKDRMVDTNTEIYLYDFYPTVSFVMRDRNIVKVDYILPNTNVDDRPIVEFRKPQDGRETIFTVFKDFFETELEKADKFFSG